MMPSCSDCDVVVLEWGYHARVRDAVTVWSMMSSQWVQRRHARAIGFRYYRVNNAVTDQTVLLGIYFILHVFS